MPKVNIRNSRPRPRNMKKTKRTEPTAVGRAIRAIAAAGGGYLGGLAGLPQPIGSAAGHQLGSMASRWLGFGDYQVQHNSILTKSADSVPYMHKEDQSVVLRHKEFVGTITGSQNFAVQYELPLNPGLNTFPWLHSIAGKFQEYKFRGVVFHYIPASGMAIAGTNSALGTVMMQTTYRPSDSAPTSKIEMLNEYCSNEVVPSDSAIHPIECDPKQNPFAVQFVRSIEVPYGESVLNYDLGKTFIATQGQQSSGTYLGDLWVTYEVELVKPVYASNVTQNPLSSFTFSDTTGNTWFTNPGSALDTLGLGFADRTITFPANCGSSFGIVIKFDATLSALSNWGAMTLTNCTSLYFRANNVVSGSAQAVLSVAIQKTDPSKECSVNFAHPTWTGAISGEIVEVIRYN